MRREALFALLGAAAAVAAVALVLDLDLDLGARPAGGGVVAGPAEWTGAGGLRAAAIPARGVPALAPAAAEADGVPDGAVAPAEVRAAPPAIVAGPGGQLVEAPDGLAGRGASRRGSPARVPWERVAVLGRVSELGKLARPVARGLAAAREQLGPCFAEERRALADGRAPPFDPADPPTGPAILILDLETRAGGVEVVSANVESLGTSTPELAGCAAQRLTGYAIDAPAAPLGQRFRLAHVLQ